jgi:hypothetical protein
MVPVAQGADDVHALELPSTFYIFYFLSPQRAPVFTHQAGINPTLIDIYALFSRNLSNLR